MVSEISDGPRGVCHDQGRVLSQHSCKKHFMSISISL